MLIAEEAFFNLHFDEVDVWLEECQAMLTNSSTKISRKIANLKMVTSQAVSNTFARFSIWFLATSFVSVASYYPKAPLYTKSENDKWPRSMSSPSSVGDVLIVTSTSFMNGTSCISSTATHFQRKAFFWYTEDNLESLPRL